MDSPIKCIPRQRDFEAIKWTENNVKAMVGFLGKRFMGVQSLFYTPPVHLCLVQMPLSIEKLYPNMYIVKAEDDSLKILSEKDYELNFEEV